MNMQSCLPILLIALYSCSGQAHQGTEVSALAAIDEPVVISMESNQNTGETKSHLVHDQQTGQVMYRMNLPAQWKFDESAKGQNPSITGPDGMAIYFQMGQSYMYPHDPSMQELYRQQGQSLRPCPGIEGLIERDLIPMFRQNQIRILSKKNVESVAANDLQFLQSLYQVAPRKISCTANLLELKNHKGEIGYAMVHLTENRSQMMDHWSYKIEYIEGESPSLTRQVEQFTMALSMLEYNREYIADYNAREAQKAQQSWSNHNARMSERERQFQAQQKNHRETYEAINQASMDTYRNSSAASDRSQEQWTDMMREENTITDPYTQEAHKVASGAEHYWINNQEQYISTDDHLYNPNIDQGADGNWEEVYPE